MVTSDVPLQLIAALLVLLIPLGLLLIDRVSIRARAASASAAVVVGMVASWALNAVLSSPSDLPARVLDASFAGAIAGGVAILAARFGPVGAAVFASLWSVLVFQPVFAATVGSVPSLVQIVFGAVDFSAVLATHVAASASMIAASLLPGPRRRVVSDLAALSRPRGMVPAGLVAVGATAWMVGAERVLSVATGRTLANSIVGLVLGALMWWLIERIAGRPFSPSGLTTGVVIAWGAIGLGVPFLAPTALGATAVIATAAGVAIVVRAPSGAIVERRVSIGIIVAVAVGGTVLALLADGFGMAATGSTALVAAQLGAVIAVAVGAFGSGLLCAGAALIAIVIAERRSTTAAQQATKAGDAEE
ncbi:hypothetical protein [Microcella sp.]|uniref:hypothetical protein n=1 Tax=Microcella sp. TaxID=1913979 RepID=UPI002563E3E0|nr:hypothetical protein [Microcella sp.]MBX9470898.1 hypothetical protein [Microcella sp.]